MIKNNICSNCDHYSVCKVADKLSPFSEDAKKDLGVTITINECIQFKEVV